MKRARLNRPIASLFAAFVAGAPIFAASAAAKTFPIPSDQPAATVDIPDSWRPTLSPNGIEGSAADGAVRLAVEFVAAPDLEEASEVAIKKLAERGVVIAPGTKRTAKRQLNGFVAFKVDFSGTDPSGEFEITLMLVAAPKRSGFVSISYWGDDEAQESVSNDLQSIADSLAVAK